MEELWENLFWIVIILIWIVSTLARSKKSPAKKELPQPQPPYKEPRDFEKEILETFGFPFPQPYKLPKPKIKPQPIPTVKEVEIRPEKPTQPLSEPVEIEKKKPESFLDFSGDKLEEGVIYSVVLGPPKAIQFCRGGGIGIHVSLKN